MEDIIGYARLMAKIRIKQETHTPFLRRPYLKYCQCLMIWGYFFQLGGILGAKHNTELDAFGAAFLGAKWPPGAAKKAFSTIALALLKEHITDSMTFGDYAIGEIMKEKGFDGNASSFFLEYGDMKIQPETAWDIAHQFSADGSALGAIYPETIRRIFANTHTPVPKEYWERARAAGLQIPQEQDRLNYEEVECEENESFKVYCRECCPEIYSILF